MPKERVSVKSKKKQMQHDPLGNIIERDLDPHVRPKVKKGGNGQPKKKAGDQEENIDNLDMEEVLDPKLLSESKRNRADNDDAEFDQDNIYKKRSVDEDDDDEDEDENENEESNDDDDDDDDDEEEDLVEIDEEGNYISKTSASEDAVVQEFLQAGRDETRTLADIIMQKLQEKELGNTEMADETISQSQGLIPPKVEQVYTAVGKLLKFYKSGKLPKALKMLPMLKNWEHVLWLTRPDEWSPAATYATTRIFASNLNAKMAQRFYNLVLLEKVRDDIGNNGKLNYYLYLSLKKSLFKPAAFYKGILLPLAREMNCTLREAVIIGSVITKVSIPGTHSAAVLLRLVEMPYCGSTSYFIKILLHKKYALPTRVVEALVSHFYSFQSEVSLFIQ